MCISIVLFLLCFLSNQEDDHDCSKNHRGDWSSDEDFESPVPYKNNSCKTFTIFQAGQTQAGAGPSQAGAGPSQAGAGPSQAGAGPSQAENSAISGVETYEVGIEACMFLYLVMFSTLPCKVVVNNIRLH